MIRAGIVQVISVVVEGTDDNGEAYTTVMLSSLEGLPLVTIDERDGEDAELAVRLIELTMEDDANA